MTLEPCPGCGKEHTRVIGGPGTAAEPKHWAGCDFCHWRTWGDTQAEAVTAWNTRAPDPRIAALTAEVARKDEALRKVMPISVEDGPDYASVYFGDGSTHSTQAMTMNPQDWLDISAALEARNV